jgi:hypothetical protein
MYFNTRVGNSFLNTWGLYLEWKVDVKQPFTNHDQVKNTDHLNKRDQSAYLHTPTPNMSAWHAQGLDLYIFPHIL